MNARLYLGSKMVTFCIAHIGNRKTCLKHHYPESQLVLLHVSMFCSHILNNICEKLVGTRGGGVGDIPQPKM